MKPGEREGVGWRPSWLDLILEIKTNNWFFFFCLFVFLVDDLPELSKTMFGWIGSLYKITDEQVLEHAGLDAFVVGMTAVYL
jgi:hypothetical protein